MNLTSPNIIALLVWATPCLVALNSTVAGYQLNAGVDQGAEAAQLRTLLEAATAGRLIWLPEVTTNGTQVASVGGRRPLRTKHALCDAILSLGNSFVDAQEWTEPKRGQCKRIVTALNDLEQGVMIRGGPEKIDESIDAKRSGFERELTELLTPEEQRDVLAGLEFGVAVCEGLDEWLKSESAKAWLNLSPDQRSRLHAELEKLRAEAKVAFAESVGAAHSRFAEAAFKSAEERIAVAHLVANKGVSDFDIYRAQLDALFSKSIPDLASNQESTRVCQLFDGLGFFTTEPNGRFRLAASPSVQVPSEIMNLLQALPESQLDRQSNISLFMKLNALQDEWISQYKLANTVAEVIGSLDPVHQPSVREAEELTARKFLDRVDKLLAEALPEATVEFLAQRGQSHFLRIRGLPAAALRGVLKPAAPWGADDLERMQQIAQEEKLRMDREAMDLQKDYLRRLEGLFEGEASANWNLIFLAIDRPAVPGLLLRAKAK
jgi:hypothetical protein